jgi:hypothetical protein
VPTPGKIPSLNQRSKFAMLTFLGSELGYRAL